MANVRIKDLTTTAATTASDDFFGVDGATNGTRKLNAYSPTFGGNLTATKVLVGDGTTSAPSYTFSSDTDTGLSWNGSGEMLFTANGQSGGTLLFFQSGTSGIIAGGNTAGGARLSLGNTGDIGLTSAGTNKSITLTPSGTGIVSINRGLAASATGTAFIVQTTDASSLSLFAELEGNATSASRYVTLNSYMGGGGGGRNLVINRYGGNLLIGTTTDGGQLLQVSGTAAISGGIVGTTTNNSAATGIVGEYVSSTVTSASPVSLTSGTHANITSISLTAGDWDVVGNVVFQPQSTTVRARSIAAVHTVSGDVPAVQLRGTLTYNTADTNAEAYSATAPAQRISISSTTTVYLIGSGTFSAGTLSAYGYIQARRVR